MITPAKTTTINGPIKPPTVYQFCRALLDFMIVSPLEICMSPVIKGAHKGAKAENAHDSVGTLRLPQNWSSSLATDVCIPLLFPPSPKSFSVEIVYVSDMFPYSVPAVNFAMIGFCC